MSGDVTAKASLSSGPALSPYARQLARRAAAAQAFNNYTIIRKHAPPQASRNVAIRRQTTHFHARSCRRPSQARRLRGGDAHAARLLEGPLEGAFFLVGAFWKDEQRLRGETLLPSSTYAALKRVLDADSNCNLTVAR